MAERMSTPLQITNKEGGQRAGHYGYAVEIIDANGEVVCRVPKPNGAEKAAFIVKAVNNHEALVKALAEALAVIEDTVGYKHSGDPWEEDAFEMGELDIHDYARDGRLEKVRALLAVMSGVKEP